MELGATFTPNVLAGAAGLLPVIEPSAFELSNTGWEGKRDYMRVKLHVDDARTVKVVTMQTRVRQFDLV